MITLLTDGSWLVCYQSDPSYRSAQYFVQDVDNEEKVCSAIWPVIYYPSDYAETIKDYSLDVKRNTVDTYENLLDNVQSYEYEGHTWNNFFHRKVETVITNLPPNFRKISLADAGYTGFINRLSGDGFVAPKFLRFDEEFHWGVTTYRPSAWYPAIHNNWYYFRYWNPATGIVRSCWAQWYTNDDGELSDAYGSPLSDPMIRLWSGVQIWMRERAAGMDYQFGTSIFSLYNPVDGSTGPYMRFYGSDTGYTAFQRFKALCRATDDVVKPSPPTRWYLIKDTGGWTFLGRALKPIFREPNWDALFPPREHKVYWPEIAAEAYQDLGMTSINGIANVKELFEMGEAVTGFLSTVKSLPSKRLAAAAQLFLSIHYGFKLTVLDAIELRKVVMQYTQKRSALSKCTARKEWDASGNHYTATYQVFYDEFAKLKSTVRQLMEISDFVLTTENWWDMVPYSFVVDWFVNVGDVLTALDNFYNLEQKHEVICVGRSILEERPLALSTIGLASNIICEPIEASCFTRYYNKRLVIPSLVPSVTINPFNHLIEAAALVISRK